MGDREQGADSGGDGGGLIDHPERSRSAAASEDWIPTREEDGWSCLHCGAHPVERYCGRCGQEVVRSRFTVRSIFAHWAAAATNLDRGFLHTVIELSRRPGSMIRDYLRGHTLPYTHPLRYLIVFVAIATFLTITFDLLDWQMELMTVDVEEEERLQRLEVLFGIMSTYFNLLLLSAVPLIAVMSWWFFRGAGYNFAEHLIFNVFVYAHQNFLYLVLFPIALIWDPNVQSLVYFPVIVAYYVWACAQFFGYSVWSSVVRGIGVTVVAYLAYWLLMGALAAFFVTMG